MATSLSGLHDLAILAFGAVVGSAVAVNGWKQPLNSLHARVDNLTAATTIVAAAAGFPPSLTDSHDLSSARSPGAPGGEG